MRQFDLSMHLIDNVQHQGGLERPDGLPRELPCTLEIGDRINFNVCDKSGVNVAGVMIEFYDGKLTAHVYKEGSDEPESTVLAKNSDLMKVCG